MTPLPFTLPAVLSLEALRRTDETALVQVYDDYPVSAARAAVILSREKQPMRPVIVLAELEPTGTTADGWQPDALLALFEAIGASAFILSCPADSDLLSAALDELVFRARIPVGVCVPHGMEGQLIPQAMSARLLLAVDDQSLSVLQREAQAHDFFAALPAPEDVEDEPQRLTAVTCGQLFSIDPAIDIDAVCDISDDDVIFSRWLLEQEESWGAIRVHVEGEDDVAVLDENQYMLRVPLALASDDPAVFEQAVRRFCGIALYDGTCDFDPDFLETLHRKYGLVLL